jgi:pullulanase/glycogen debranching enzyme
LRPARWLDGRPAAEWAERDVSWFGPGGSELIAHDWDRPGQRALCVHVAGHPGAGADAAEPLQSRYLLLFNADSREVSFVLPEVLPGPWQLAFDTVEPQAVAAPRAPGDVVVLPPSSAQIYFFGLRSPTADALALHRREARTR